MIRYECPNGHAFDSAVAVVCPECAARVTCVPLARLIEQGGEIARLRAALVRIAGLDYSGLLHESPRTIADAALQQRPISGAMET